MKQLLFAITLGLLLASCDDHKDFPDTATKVGHVLCTDGRVLSLSDCEAQGKRPIAVVFHINQREDIEGDGYAVYLWDLAPVAFADTLGIAQGTSADIAALDGNTNTFALYGKEKVCSPLAWAANPQESSTSR